MSARFGVALLSVALALAGCGTRGFTSLSAASSPVSAQPTFATSTTVSASPLTAGLGQTVTISARVTGFGGAPEGQVTFADGQATLGSAAVQANGTATLAVTTLAAGVHTLNAAYTGFVATASADGAAASTSAAGATVTVQGPATTVPVTAHATIALTNPAQQIAGFGGAEVYYKPYVLTSPYEQEIMQALFDPQQGLGLTFLRIENEVRWFAPGQPLDPDVVTFVNGATATAGKRPVLLMTEGSPPANLKGNGVTTTNSAADPLNTLKKVNGQYDYADFAQYWADSLTAYAAIGIVPDLLSIQNEPDFTATFYDSCRFTPTEAAFQGVQFAGYAQAFDAVYRKLQTQPNAPKMIGPELWLTNGAETQAYGQALPPTEVYAFAHHLYDLDPSATTVDFDLPDLAGYTQAMSAVLPATLRFETEYSEVFGFDTAWAIYNDLVVGKDNAYFYWSLTWPNTPTDQEGLIYTDNPATPKNTWQQPHGWVAQDNYYALKHYSLYVRPGYTLYPVTVDNADERVSSYASADKKTVVVVLLNASATATDTVALNFAGLNVSGSTVYRSTFSVPLTTSGAERWNNLGALPTGNTVTLGPQAVATLVLTLG